MNAYDAVVSTQQKESPVESSEEPEPEPAQTLADPQVETTVAAEDPSPPPAASTISAGVDEPESESEPEVEGKWYDDLWFGAFVDGYAAFNANVPALQGGTTALRAFDRDSGFSLAWAGLDVAYDGDKAGATLSLRYGPATNYGWADDSIPGIQHVKQAFATWKVSDRFSLDFGRFDTIYGAEVAESWMNHTYTRGLLYNLAQPFWHTGLRGSAQFTDTLGVNVMLVNGWGHIVDNNIAKSVGAQLKITPGDVFGLYLGYLGGPENPDVDPESGDRVKSANRRFRHLADVVMTLDWKKLSMAFNADYVFDDAPEIYGGASQWWGAMASIRYAFVERFAMAARGEFLGDPDGWMTGTDALLSSATLTLDLQPVDHLVLRLEGRYDGSDERLFPKGLDDTSQHQATVTLGVVVSSF